MPATELWDAAHPQELHGSTYLAREDAGGPLDAAFATGHQPVEVGAADEDTARALANRLTGESPAGCTVTVEGPLASVEADIPPNPFAVFGGLGG